MGPCRRPSIRGLEGDKVKRLHAGIEVGIAQIAALQLKNVTSQLDCYYYISSPERSLLDFCSTGDLGVAAVDLVGTASNCRKLRRGWGRSRFRRRRPGRDAPKWQRCHESPRPGPSDVLLTALPTQRYVTFRQSDKSDPLVTRHAVKHRAKPR